MLFWKGDLKMYAKIQTVLQTLIAKNYKVNL